MSLLAEPLTAAAFAPYGEVLEAPAAPGRLHFDGALATSRPGAAPSLSFAFRPSLETLPPVATVMERHAFSSQSFIPLEPGRFLVLVAPHALTGGPDMALARAFVAGPGQGVTYGMDVWHHGLTVLDRPMRFAILMWRDGTSGDEEFVTVAPLTITLPQSTLA